MLSIKPQFNQLIESFSEHKKPLWGAANASGGTNLTSEIVNFILTQALICRASDIHLEPRNGLVVVRYRIDGKLHEVLEIEETNNINILPRIKILANIPTDSVSSRKSWDGRFAMDYSGRKFDFRVATFPTVLGDKIAIRILIKDLDTTDIKKIGLSVADFSRLERIIQHKT